MTVLLYSVSSCMALAIYHVYVYFLGASKVVCLAWAMTG